ncbi:hypothetical protein E8K88_02600 [Lampropedia aestuarii]|uniref:VapC45 PIN like domain-containing protein n=1 Tax=Lampropedia aestuarii TaxID=2562762 RepID=A0A4V3YXR0_9BURK|nr:hypothetical protein [Lampropedia aestuarii]THJ36172.1 hypothetical protein E8K88_02600 [Lampropedia aestuarii]
MKFFLDNNLPPNWAECVSGCSRNQFSDGHVQTVTHLRAMFPASTDDLVWIEQLGHEKNWAIISQDKFRKKQGGERLALKASGISVFVLQKSWSSYPYWEKTAQFILWWPKIVELANNVEGVAMEVPWRLSGKFQQL